MPLVIPSWLSKLRIAIGKFYDLMTIGRKAGLYDKSARPGDLSGNKGELDKPFDPRGKR